MSEKLLKIATVCGALACAPAQAQTVVLAGSGGETYEVFATRDLPNDLRGAAVEIGVNGRFTLIEYAFDCANPRYAYLGIIHDNAKLWVGQKTIAKLQGFSDSIIGDGLQSVPLTPLSTDPSDVPIAELRQLTCA